MSDLSDPPIPANVDLSGYEFMPLYGHKLFGSNFNAICNDAEWRAGVTLWWAAWNQVPAGSLPNDDAALCRLADLGKDVKGWKKIKGNALHGFVLCNDGRLYNGMLCALAAEAWERRMSERDRKRKWREKKEGHGTGQDADVPGTKTGTGRGRDADVPAERKGQDRTGKILPIQGKGSLSQDRARQVRDGLPTGGSVESCPFDPETGEVA